MHDEVDGAERQVDFADGIVTWTLPSWQSVGDAIGRVIENTANLHPTSYIWRGQRRDDWELTSSIDRMFKRLGVAHEETEELEKRSKVHLERFKMASRGRRGPTPATLAGPSDWWALGQHFGLATPLLDWTRSPYAAAYFAFEELPQHESDCTEYRVIYGLEQSAVVRANVALAEALDQPAEHGRSPTLDFFEPPTDENPRLVSQNALFTRAPVGMSIEQWVAINFAGSDEYVLVRLRVPDRDRHSCLRALDLMNINHLSLFPDLSGASRYVNLRAEIFG